MIIYVKMKIQDVMDIIIMKQENAWIKFQKDFI